MMEIYYLLIAVVVDVFAKKKIYCTLFFYLVTKNSTVPRLLFSFRFVVQALLHLQQVEGTEDAS